MNILKEKVASLSPAPIPQLGKILQVRSGKVKTLGDEKSGIFKEVHQGLVDICRTGIISDEHVYHTHGGIDRAIHQYASGHYADWGTEKPDGAHLFQSGGIGENLVGTGLTEENICIGDLFRIGGDVIM